MRTGKSKRVPNSACAERWYGLPRGPDPTSILGNPMQPICRINPNNNYHYG